MFVVGMIWSSVCLCDQHGLPPIRRWIAEAEREMAAKRFPVGKEGNHECGAAALKGWIDEGERDLAALRMAI